MKKKKKMLPQEDYSTPDRNPELNTDLEIKKRKQVREEDLDLIRDEEYESEIINDDLNANRDDV